MAIRQVAKRRLTLAQFLALPETKPASELIDGEVIQKPVAKVPHSNAQAQIIGALLFHPATRPGKALPEQGANLGPDHRVPDVSWFAPGRLDGVTDYPDFPPDLAVGIRSEGQTKESQRQRLAFYRSRGTVATLLVDPSDRTVEVHDGDRSFTARDGDVVTIESIGGFTFDTSTVW